LVCPPETVSYNRVGQGCSLPRGRSIPFPSSRLPSRKFRLATQIVIPPKPCSRTPERVSAIPLSQQGLLAALSAELSGAHPPIVVTSPNALARLRCTSEVKAVCSASSGQSLLDQLCLVAREAREPHERCAEVSSCLRYRPSWVIRWG